MTKFNTKTNVEYICKGALNNHKCSIHTCMHTFIITWKQCGITTRIYRQLFSAASGVTTGPGSPQTHCPVTITSFFLSEFLLLCQINCPKDCLSDVNATSPASGSHWHMWSHPFHSGQGSCTQTGVWGHSLLARPQARHTFVCGMWQFVYPSTVPTLAWGHCCCLPQWGKSSSIEVHLEVTNECCVMP